VPSAPDLRGLALRTAGRPPAIAAAIWTAVYVGLCATGQRFSTVYLDFGWQLIPREILRADPIGSTWYLHIQPPLWNLTIGTILRWSPFSDAISLQLLQFALGVVMVAMLASIADRISGRRAFAVVVAVIAGVHPDVIGNAFQPTYEMPTAALLVTLVWLLTSARRDRRDRLWFAAVAAIASATALTRSLYHPAWIAILLAVVTWQLCRATGWRMQWRTIAIGCAIPLLTVGGWMVKNEVLFGQATLSSWFGMNMQRAVIPVLPAADLDRLYAAGDVSDIAIVGPFGNYDLYKPFVPPCTPQHDNPATAVPLRRNEVVVPNFNYECFLPVFSRAGSDAWAVIKDSPETFVEGRLWSARTWFALNGGSASSPSIVMRTLDRANKIVGVGVPGVISTAGWGTPIYGTLEADANFSLAMVALSLAVLAAASRAAWRMWRHRATATGAATGADLAVAVNGFIVLWTFASGIVFELGEQARFRTMIDPLVIVVGLLVIVPRVESVLRRRWSVRSSDVGGRSTGGGDHVVDEVIPS
jgi:hypothetical protein